MLVHILDFAATYMDITLLETDSNCLGQWGSMDCQGEHTKLPSKHPTPRWVMGAMSASEECSCLLLSPAHLVHDEMMGDGLRPYWGSQCPRRLPSS